MTENEAVALLVVWVVWKRAVVESAMQKRIVHRLGQAALSNQTRRSTATPPASRGLAAAFQRAYAAVKQT